VLAWPARSVDAIGRIVRPLAAVAAASDHGVAALALQDRGSVVVGPIRAGSLVESVVALLPAERAGPGHPVLVPVDVVRRLLAADDATDLADLTDLTSRAELPAEDAGLLLRLAEGRVRGGQFGVNVQAGGGRLRRGIPVVSWFDTAEGRYLMTNDGTTLLVAPADAARIAVRLHEVLGELG
jgi:ESX secretion-associated protein EspG